MLKELEAKEQALFAELDTVRQEIKKEKLRIAEQEFGVAHRNIYGDWELMST